MKINPITVVNNYNAYVDHTLEANLDRVLERLQANRQVSQVMVENLLRTAGARFADTCEQIRAFYKG